ncbi:hypothetical protein [Burkholderia vietnamiensis]|uniref:hypothetical protein n=1 Tax=Burkholderia vietnamiensis TaxID=60552 RepID=UPI00075B350E|nr:hypothetical protein [Burkholderia vietnamiensis]KVE11290.1 hypothetical protein WI92_18685 [Burkholderia vietnamiensis]
MTEPTEDDTKDDHWARRHAIVYNAEMSALYHQKRERFFELGDKLTKVASLLGGSAALYKVSEPSVIGAVAVMITTASALSLVFGFSERARKHAELSREFKGLISEISRVGPFDFADDDLKAWDEARCRLEIKEPPALSLLVVICQNELAIAQNQPSRVVHISFWKRILANFIDLPVPVLHNS